VTDLNVTYSAMSEASGKLRAGKHEIETQLTTLRSIVEHLTQAGFVTDHASGAFNEQYAQLTQGLTTAIAGIDGMAQFLDQTAQQFESTDSSIAGAIRNQ
jgi:WXG100 family type VII secretion target